MATINLMNSTVYTIKTTSNTTQLILNTAGDASYSFGFSGWTYKTKPVYDEFELYVWEQRKAVGIDEPMPEPIGWEPVSYTGQILHNSTLTVTSATNSTTGQIYGITS